MKVSKTWLTELVDLKITIPELEQLLPLRTIATKEITDDFIELDMKGYNRADLLSMRGVAYEVAAITDCQVKFEEPDPTKLVWVEQSLPKLDVKVGDEKLAPVYCLAKIEGLKVEPSNPDWVKKLADSGMRTVNNVADVTNLVMLEYGQPLHAFDASAVKDEKIVVRPAYGGEKITTLDGKTRDLETSDLLIADPQNNLGIAGVMGGKNSEISDNTTTVLLEAAIFDPGNLRKTSQRLGLVSEASKRFYHGLTRKRLLQALDAAIRMYQKMGGKLTALAIVGDTQDQAKKVPLTLKKTQSLIGVEIPEQQIEKYLKKLNFGVESAPAEAEDEESSHTSGWVVTPPYYRLDIDIEEDLIEEVARIYGYENIPAKELVGDLPEKVDQRLFDLISRLKTVLADQGLTELQTYSYFSTAVLKNLGWLENNNNFPLIKVANPISSETKYLRVNLWSNLVEKVAENLKYFDQVAVFEIGKAYEVIDSKINEEYRLALALSDGGDNPLVSLKQIIDQVLESQNLKLEVGDKLPPLPDNKEIFHPNRQAILKLNDQPIGGMAEVHPRIINQFGTEKRIAVAEIKLQQLVKIKRL